MEKIEIEKNIHGSYNILVDGEMEFEMMEPDEIAKCIESIMTGEYIEFKFI